MNSSVPLRVVFLTQGEAPPEGVVQMLQHPQVAMDGQELDAFFASLDGGAEVPDMLVGVGGESLVGALRRHAITACLPLFRWGSTTTVPPGWDGSLVRWNPAALADVDAWAAPQNTWPSIEAHEENGRREHAFLRFLATRGQASLADAKLFGVKAPHAALRRWQERGWCQGSVQRLTAQDSLWDVVARPNLQEATAKPQAKVVEVLATPTTEPAPPPVEPHRPRRALLWSSVVVVLAVSAVLVQQNDGIARLRAWIKKADQPLQHEIAQVERPEVPTEPLDQSPEVAPAPPQAELPELYLDGHLIRPQIEVLATVDGHLHWKSKYAQQGAAIEGAEVATLTQTAGIDRSDRLQGLQEEMESEFDAQQAVALDRWKAEERNHQQEVARHRATVSSLERRLPAARETYAKAKALAEEGILSFREVRPDWEALLGLEEELEEATAAVTAAQASLVAWQEQGPPDLQEQPGWQAQARVLEVQLAEAKASQIEVSVRVPRAGEFRPVVSPGERVQEGQIIGLLTPWNDGYLEAVLATPDWNPAYLAGNARLRRPGRSSWMPTRILSAASEPDGLTRLKLRLPVGWLDDTLALADADRELLELRLTPPQPQAESRSEGSQPPAGPSVENPQ